MVNLPVSIAVALTVPTPVLLLDELLQYILLFSTILLFPVFTPAFLFILTRINGDDNLAYYIVLATQIKSR